MTGNPAAHSCGVTLSRHDQDQKCHSEGDAEVHEGRSSSRTGVVPGLDGARRRVCGDEGPRRASIAVAPIRRPPRCSDRGRRPRLLPTGPSSRRSPGRRRSVPAGPLWQSARRAICRASRPPSCLGLSAFLPSFSATSRCLAAPAERSRSRSAARAASRAASSSGAAESAFSWAKPRLRLVDLQLRPLGLGVAAGSSSSTGDKLPTLAVAVLLAFARRRSRYRCLSALPGPPRGPSRRGRLQQRRGPRPGPDPVASRRGRPPAALRRRALAGAGADAPGARGPPAYAVRPPRQRCGSPPSAAPRRPSCQASRRRRCRRCGSCRAARARIGGRRPSRTSPSGPAASPASHRGCSAQVSSM